MKKIPTMFVRDEKDRSRVLPIWDTRCEWVWRGEGVATMKLDGSSCMVRGDRLFKRFDAKHGKTPPPNFEPCEPEPDPATGHWPGWIPVGDEPSSKWHIEAWKNMPTPTAAGTYELIGPRVQGNPYGGKGPHQLVRHGLALLPDAPRTFDELVAYLAAHPMEGIVFHHADGRMAKVKSRDLGLPWPVPPT